LDHSSSAGTCRLGALVTRARPKPASSAASIDDRPCRIVPTFGVDPRARHGRVSPELRKRAPRPRWRLPAPLLFVACTVGGVGLPYAITALQKRFNSSSSASPPFDLRQHELRRPPPFATRLPTRMGLYRAPAVCAINPSSEGLSPRPDRTGRRRGRRWHVNCSAPRPLSLRGLPPAPHAKMPRKRADRPRLERVLPSELLQPIEREELWIAEHS
jgi:hypothetical protein